MHRACPEAGRGLSDASVNQTVNVSPSFYSSAVTASALGRHGEMCMAPSGQFLAGVRRLDVVLAMLFVGCGFLGLVVRTTTVLALEKHGAIAGMASALMGTLQFVTGALVMAIAGLFVGGSARPMAANIAGFALVAYALTRSTLRGAPDAGALPPAAGVERRSNALPGFHACRFAYCTAPREEAELAPGGPSLR